MWILHFFRDLLSFRQIEILISFSSLIFMQNLMKHSGIKIFLVISHFNIIFLGKKVYWIVFGRVWPLDRDPWIRIFMQIRIKEVKMLRIQILRTHLNKGFDGRYIYRCLGRDKVPRIRIANICGSTDFNPLGKI